MLQNPLRFREKEKSQLFIDSDISYLKKKWNKYVFLRKKKCQKMGGII
jgi:hypothetical protein